MLRYWELIFSHADCIFLSPTSDSIICVYSRTEQQERNNAAVHKVVQHHKLESRRVVKP